MEAGGVNEGGLPVCRPCYPMLTSPEVYLLEHARSDNFNSTSAGDNHDDPHFVSDWGPELAVLQGEEVAEAVPDGALRDVEAWIVGADLQLRVRHDRETPTEDFALLVLHDVRQAGLRVGDVHLPQVHLAQGTARDELYPRQR